MVPRLDTLYFYWSSPLRFHVWYMCDVNMYVWVVVKQPSAEAILATAGAVNRIGAVVRFGQAIIRIAPESQGSKPESSVVNLYSFAGWALAVIVLNTELASSL